MKKRLIYIILGLIVALFIVMNGFSGIFGENFSNPYPAVPSGRVVTGSDDPGI